ncbi:CPBP family intramembrane metalloprotease [Parabacteroides sp. OttesenSCG-928-G07]|nr:CPBP family intramembrane metalloprotease [Parabacteroides sp. OttesenSCG-928-G07]
MEEKLNFNKCIINVFVGFLILYGAEILGLMFSSGISLLISFQPINIILNSLFYISIASFCVLQYAKRVKLSLLFREDNSSSSRTSLVILAILFPVIYTFISFLLLDGKGYWERGWDTHQQLVNNSLRIFMDKGLGAGIVEELIFRGLIMKSIKLFSNKKKSILYTSLLFSILHIPAFGSTIIVFLLDALTTFSLSILLSIIVYKSGSLAIGMLCHAAINIINCCFYFGDINNIPTLYRYIPYENNAVYINTLTGTVVVLCCIFATFYLKRAKE